METPPEGFSTRAKVVRVVDGDTVDVIIKRRMRIRLEDCWAPETRTKNLDEKLKGLESKEFAEVLLRRRLTVCQMQRRPVSGFVEL